MWTATISIWVFLLFGADTPNKSENKTDGEVPPAVQNFLDAMEASRLNEIRRLQDRVKELEAPTDDKTKLRSRRQELRLASRRIKMLEMSAGKLPHFASKEKFLAQLPTLQPRELQGRSLGVFNDKNIKYISYQILSESEVLVKAKYTEEQPSEKLPQAKFGNEQVIPDVFVVRGLPTKDLKESTPIDLADKVFQVTRANDFATGVPGARVVSLVDVFDVQPILDWLGKRRTVKPLLTRTKTPPPQQKVETPKTEDTQSEKTPSKDDREKRAAGKLRLAIKFIKIKPKIAERRLNEICEEFPNTQAAKEALEYLQKLKK